MAHIVTCVYCKKKFDRDKEPYAQISQRRYAHADCALKECEKDSKKEKPKIIDPNSIVNCVYCKKQIDITKEPFQLISKGKYAHLECYEKEENKELTDQEKLNEYIMKLFNSNYIYPKIKKQINDYVKNNGYTYSGIQKALIYYYEVKGNTFDINKTQGGIGIVPYVYEQAFNYYYSIWLAQQNQKEIVNNNRIKDYIPKDLEIHIKSPKRIIKKRKLFSFLDDDDNEMKGE